MTSSKKGAFITNSIIRYSVGDVRSSGTNMFIAKNINGRMTLNIFMCRFRFFSTVIVSTVMASAIMVSTAMASTEDERLKALFLYNFANFVDWPESAFQANDSDLRLCLFGDISFGSMLDAVDGTLIGNHRLSLKRTKKLKEIETGCHMLFVSHEQRIRLPHFFTQIQYMYVLSVGDRKGFAVKGGVINIVRTEDQMQFDINLSTAMANGLTVSSDLLSLAREVKRLTPQYSDSSSRSLR
ncbi:MAG: YfiR family protein [Pseudomonadales bacterium]|nr:YfiR family protein [Pseudomonadales bacterium]